MCMSIQYLSCLLSHMFKVSSSTTVDSDTESGFSQPKRIFTGSSGSLLSPASLQLSSQSNHLVQQLHSNNQMRNSVDMPSQRPQLHRYLFISVFINWFVERAVA